MYHPIGYTYQNGQAAGQQALMWRGSGEPELTLALDGLRRAKNYLFHVLSLPDEVEIEVRGVRLVAVTRESHARAVEQARNAVKVWQKIYDNEVAAIEAGTSRDYAPGTLPAHNRRMGDRV